MDTSNCILPTKCVKCRTPRNTNGKSRCDKCLKKHREYHQRLRDKRAKNRVCTRCGDPCNHEHRLTCDKCIERLYTHKKLLESCIICNRSRSEIRFIRHGNTCVDCRREQQRTWRTGIGKAMHAEAQRRHRRRDFVSWLRRALNAARTMPKTVRHENWFTITIDDVMRCLAAQECKCKLTGILMTHEPGIRSASIDRIDSLKGYHSDNIQLVCKGINFLKNKYSNAVASEFIQLIRSTTH